jgi:hypothetical protein
MANVLKVSHQEAIRSLHDMGSSQRRIAHELLIKGANRQALYTGRVKMQHHFDPWFAELSRMHRDGGVPHVGAYAFRHLSSSSGAHFLIVVEAVH